MIGKQERNIISNKQHRLTLSSRHISLSQRIAEELATFAPTAHWAGEKRRELTVRYVKWFIRPISLNNSFYGHMNERGTAMLNYAYTDEYQAYRRTFDYIFNKSYEIGNEEIRLSEGNIILKITKYCDDSCSNFEYRVNTSKTKVYSDDGNYITEFKNIDYAHDFYKIIKHKNGINYLLYAIDLYGYCVLNLETYENYYYVPDKSINNGETLIWLNVHYCIDNNSTFAH